MIGDFRRSPKTVSATGLGQESGRGRERVSGNPVLMETGVRADDSSPGIYLNIYTLYLLPVIYLHRYLHSVSTAGIYLEIYKVYLLPVIYLDIYTTMYLLGT